MLHSLHLIVTGSLALQPQLRPEDFRNDDLVYSARNAKYHLVCELHGHTIANPRDVVEDRIEEVVVRNEQTGEKVTYDPPSSETDSPNLDIRDVWSPDGEWLLLSQGIHAGFRLIKANDALAELKRPKPNEFLRLEGRKYKYKHGLYHQFLGWRSPASFYFAVTEDSHTLSVYEFSPKDLSLNPIFDGDGVADTYITSKGERPIPVVPMITAAPNRE